MKTQSYPQPVRCYFCDFSSGYRGMNYCGKCEGTGSIFVVGDAIFPNTEEGYHSAVAASAKKRELENVGVC